MRCPPISDAFFRLCSFENLYQAWRAAARRKRYRASTLEFSYRWENQLFHLQQELLSGAYQPGAYHRFKIHEPKQRLISAAPFRDRVLHHALCQIIEPRFEEVFIVDSYANRVHKGTHKAIARFQQFARKYPWVIRMDIRRHFESIDHEILLTLLAKKIPEAELLVLVNLILSSGVQQDSILSSLFPGDDLFAMLRPKGLPIGNLTSQFWSNCYLHPLDLFIKRELSCKAYLRYVDDFALFHKSKSQLWEWKQAIIERLSQLRLRIHETRAQVMPTAVGSPWLGMVIYPEYVRLKGRKKNFSRRRLRAYYQQYYQGEISFAEFDARVKGWINYVGHADTWGLRSSVLESMVWRRDYENTTKTGIKACRND